MGTPSESQRPPDKPRELGCTSLIAIAAIFVWVVMIAIPPMPGGLKNPHRNAWMQQARQMGQVLFSYSTDNVANNNAYPDGASSTEICQKLLDSGYVTDPMIFYVPMPGKVAPEPGQKKLKPENVSWDITAPAGPDSPDLLPLVFLTGYKVDYVAGGSAIPLKPGLSYGYRESPKWWQPLLGWTPIHYEESQGIAAFYKGNNSVYLKADVTPNGTIRNFVSPSYRPDGKTYRQLTPDGVLP